MKRPYGFKGTLLVFRKKNFAIDVSVRVDQEAPRTITAILDTGAGPSVVSEDILLAGWQNLASRAPKSTHACDASGQLLKGRGVLELSAIVNGKAMVFEFLVVKALSVPLILGLDFQKDYVKAIYPGSEAVLWANGDLTYAKRSWDGKKPKALPVRGNPVKRDPAALYLSKGVTLASRSVQAAFVKCGSNGTCLLYERPDKLVRKGRRLHNALATIEANEDFRLYLTNLTERPENLPKNFAVGLAVPYEGPVHEAPLEDLPQAGEEAMPPAILALSQETLRDAARPGPESGSQGQDDEAMTPGERPEKPAEDEPMPTVAYDLVPKSLHGAVRTLLYQNKGLWGGQLGRMDITPHRITLTDGTKPVRSQPYRTGLRHRDLIRNEVAKQLQLGVIEPSQAEWSFPVVLVPKHDGTPRFCVDYRRLNDLTVRDTYPLPRMDDCIDFLGEA
eukprot:contig_21047_g5164